MGCQSMLKDLEAAGGEEERCILFDMLHLLVQVS